jgi:hypothetical protein
MSSLLLEGLKIGFYVLLFFSSPFFLGALVTISRQLLPTLSHKKRKKGEEKKRLKIYPFLQSSREDLILTGNDML